MDSTAGQLCSRCQKLEPFIIEALSKGPTELEIFKDWRLGTRNRSRRSWSGKAVLEPVEKWAMACDLCSLLRNSIPPDYNPRKGPELIVYLKPGGRFDMFGEYQEQAILSIEAIEMMRQKPIMFVCSYSQLLWPLINTIGQPRQDFPFRFLSSEVDFSIIKGWVKTCYQSHTECLNIQDHNNNRNSVDFKMQVINCNTRQIIPAELGCEYTALSYVWGPPNTDLYNPVKINNLDYLPEVAPNVVEDALRVTLELGMCFLWVDRYCIDSQDDFERLNQIANMHRVYGKAKVTIIAAAGMDPSHGLPGVASRKRVSRNWAQIGNRRLLSTFCTPTRDIGGSEWMTRGWTYQEAVFSSRKLFFTDRQVYFECDQMNCREVEICPRSGANAFAGLKKCSPEELLGYHIPKYSSRELTYDRDHLNGMMGILQATEELSSSLTNIWGHPLHVSPTRPSDQNFIYSLLHKRDHHTRSRRMTDFPSWSWTGWSGRTAFISGESEAVATTDIDIAIELKNGSLVNLSCSDLDEDGKKQRHASLSDPNVHQAFTHFLHIKARMYQFKLYNNSGVFIVAWITFSQIRPAKVQYHRVRLDTALEIGSSLFHRLETALWDSVLLETTPTGADISNARFLILEPKEGPGSSQYYERIGWIDTFDEMDPLESTLITSPINVVDRGIQTIRIG